MTLPTPPTTGVPPFEPLIFPELWNQLVGLRLVVAVLLVAYLGWVVAARLTSDEDPSLRYQSGTGAGETSILLSGTHVTLFLVGGIVFVTWPLVMNSQLVALFLGGVVVVHYIVEKREVRG